MNRKLLSRFALSVFAALVAVGCGSGSTGDSAPGVDLHGIAVTLSDFMIMPMSLTGKGANAAFAVSNVGETPHNFSIRDSDGTLLAHTPTIEPGDSAELETTLKTGTYVTFCSLPGHESLGMKGTLVLSP